MLKKKIPVLCKLSLLLFYESSFTLAWGILEIPCKHRLDLKYFSNTLDSPLHHSEFVPLPVDRCQRTSKRGQAIPRTENKSQRCFQSFPS